ncbi:hypothetical protein PVAND_004873 [Polypedilum vanderplanki]|uniref:Protein Skeletor n=1 Tax=Polypedilum vanderplanki TaxID=319348 RepID=A0A9J6BY82_POLVA|nr:hypothetical protein PVAND_004873 [Polypedilum vanderplanki]
MELWKVLLVLCAVNFVTAQKNYYGTHIGRLSEYHHSVSGDVFAVDSRTLFIKSFNYDGEGPAAYFYVGNSKTPSNQGGFRIRDETGNPGVLKRYINKDITLTLPEGKTLKDIRWFSVWCDEFSVDFGNVMIPKNLEFPRPQKIGGLQGIHAVHSDNIVIVDAQTLLIPNFSYDGTAPDAKFWVGVGQKPSSNGLKIPDENGKELPLRRYDRKTIVLTLPNHLTIFDIGHFGVWCEAFAVDFGHVRIPDKINVPPSLKMLGISPQSKLNCEVLHDELAFEVRWAVAGESIVIQLVAKLDDNEYMSFGVSPDLKNSVMIGADVVVSWVNRLNGKGYAQDYFLDAKSQCSGNRGSCPDTRLKDNTNSIRLLNAAIVNDYSIVTYQRPLKAADLYDLSIYTNQSQAIVWAIGPLNQRFEVSYHSQFLKKNKLIDFGRQPFWNCPIPDSETKPLIAETESTDRVLQQPRKPASNSQPTRRQPPPTQATTTTRAPATPKPVAKRDAWEIPPIQCDEPEDGVFYAQMGPTGGKRGYPAITGHVGWGIAWYINGLLIPEINVVRGKTYTFVIEGGNNKTNPANYHPFYITDDSVGGYENKNDAEKEQVKIFAGVQKSRANGKITPIGVGRICNWTPELKGPTADEYTSFGAYQRSLTLKCEEGDPGIVTFKPDHNTPDTVYYQCFTHRYLGWKINVHDSCEQQPQASERQEVIVDIDAEPSIRHESKLAPSENFLKQHEKDLIKHHNMNGAPPKLPSELTNNTEFRKLIAEGIRTAEALEAALVNEHKNNSTIQTANKDEISPKLPQIEIKQAVRKPPFIPPHLLGRPHFSSAQIPIYLRPQIPYRPIKPYPPSGPQIPIVRQPVYDRRPPLPPLPSQLQTRPHQHLIPQSSIQINHYKKPVHPPLQSLPPQIKNNLMRGKLPIPPQLPGTFQKPVLMLGEPTEIKAPYRKSGNDVVVGKPSKTQVDLTAAFGKNKNIRPLVKVGNKKTEKIPFKEPYNIKNDSSSIEDIAENTGFKAESIIVESGFRPIFKREDVFINDEDDDEEPQITAKIPSISRRSDVNINENQFYPSDEAQSFEPVFIPSPEDSVALPLIDSRENETDMMMAEATERHGVYYLPPNDVKRSAILDPLDLKDPLPSSDIQKLSSKTKKFIQDTPQFLPFKGELPLSLQANIASSSSSVIKEKPISTRLSAVHNNEDT